MGSNYVDLPLVADETVRRGHITFGVIYDGAFVVLGQHKVGHVQAAVERVDELGPAEVSSPHTAALDELGKRVDDVVADTKGLTKQVASLASPKPPAAPKPKG